ncbi:hypothetical protein [Streptomyces sp. NPDC002640]
MKAETVIATAATFIALGSLYVSVMQTRLNLRHYKHSIRPLLQLRRIRDGVEGVAGIELTNAGLGPAVVIESMAYLDGASLGQWRRSTWEQVIGPSPNGVQKYALRAGVVLLPGQSVYLLKLAPFDRYGNGDFGDLVLRRLHIEVRYESLYGGEDFAASTSTPTSTST